QPLGDAPAVVELDDEVLLRDFDVGEEHLGEMPLARDHLDRPYVDALRLHVDQDEADAFLLAALVGPNKAKTPVGISASRRPDLLAIDEVVISLVFGLGSQGREIRA